jgi:hypothetical protein
MQSVLFWLFFCIPLADYFTYKCNLWCVADPGKVLRCPAITPINPECEQTFKTILIFAVGLNITQQFYESTITNASQRASYFDSIPFSCFEPFFNINSLRSTCNGKVAEAVGQQAKTFPYRRQQVTCSERIDRKCLLNIASTIMHAVDFLLFGGG